MIRNFFRHFAESLKSLKRNGWMTLASVSAVTVTLVLVGLFFAVIFNVTNLAKQVENDVRIRVVMNYEASDDEVTALKEELKLIPNVTDVEFSSKSEELSKLQSNYGSFKLFDEDSNPLSDVFLVSADDTENVKKVASAAKKLPGVEKADYGNLPVDRIFAISKAVQTWGVGGAILLLFVAVFLISNTIRITIISRSREIQIMRLVGAKNGYIRGPFYFEGAWIGLLGSVIPILLMTFLYTRVYTVLNSNLVASGYSLITPNDFLLKVNLLMLGVGVIIGSLGSVLSMRRFLKI